jgi:hypothetical protein
MQHVAALLVSQANILKPKPLRDEARRMRHASATIVRILNSPAKAQLLKLCGSLDVRSGWTLAWIFLHIDPLCSALELLLKKLDPPLDAIVKGEHRRATAGGLKAEEHIAAYVIEALARFDRLPGKTNERAQAVAEEIHTLAGGRPESCAWESVLGSTLGLRGEGLTKSHAALFDAETPMEAFGLRLW